MFILPAVTRQRNRPIPPQRIACAAALIALAAVLAPPASTDALTPPRASRAQPARLAPPTRAVPGGSADAAPHAGVVPQAADGHTASRRGKAPAKHKHRKIPKIAVLVEPAVAVGPAVPENFLGLSFEASELPALAGYSSSSANLVNLLRSLGPGVLRIGGISADTTAAWQPEGPLPSWAQSAITPQDLAALAAVARASGWRVLLTVNFGHSEAAVDAQEAQVAQAQLGSSLAGIAIGNEPDRYVPDLLRPLSWSLANYLAETESYRAAIAAAAPGVPIVGPDTSTGQPALPWLASVASAQHPPLLTEHYYPLTSCATVKPTLPDLLSPLTRQHESALLAQLYAIAQSSQLPLRIDETNNVSCRGQPGVSNVFASALWAVDYLARAMTSGVVGVNFHDLLSEPLSYSPLVAGGGSGGAGGASPASGGALELPGSALHANPEWYALLLARHLLGDHAVHATVVGGERSLTSSAFLSPNGNLHILLVNFAPNGAPTPIVQLHLPGQFRAGPIMRLTAPTLRSTSHVALGGSEVSASGSWAPLAHPPHVTAANAGVFALTLPASSAALVTLYP